MYFAFLVISTFKCIKNQRNKFYIFAFKFRQSYYSLQVIKKDTKYKDTIYSEESNVN